MSLNIVIPMAGGGASFKEAGYTFPKPLIDIRGKTMIETVVDNIRPTSPHRFIFVCLKDQYEKYDLYNVLKRATNNNFEVVQLSNTTQGAACTALTASRFIKNDDELIIANADQIIDVPIDDFLASARSSGADGHIITFKATHPRWSYARANAQNIVEEVAEKKVISDHATSGIYYWKKGSYFVEAAEEMIHKNIRYNNEFYISPSYNELILSGKKVSIFEIPADKMHSLGTPEDLKKYA